MAQSVSGKTAIVTGAGSGINLEFARELLGAGANVVLADLALRAEAQDLVSEYQSNPKAVFQKTDVTSWTQLEDMFQAAEKNFGQVDIVCPGAGVFEPVFSNFWHPPGGEKSKDDPKGDRYRAMDINLIQPIRVTQMAISRFLEAGVSPENPRSIIHIASIAGEGASLPFPLYHAAKHGVIGFVKSLADLEHLYGIRVAAVLPGIIKTPLWTDHPDKLKAFKEEAKDGEEHDTWILPQDIAKVMLALVKDNETSSSILGGEHEPLKIQGGTCLEVLYRYIRDVPLFGNIGPQATGKKGISLQNAMDLYKDATVQIKPGFGKY